MIYSAQPRVISIFGTIYLLISLAAYLLMGPKGIRIAMAGSSIGIVSWVFSWYNSLGKVSVWPAFLLTLGSAIIFGQRAIANFLAIIGIVQHNLSYDAFNKCIAIVLLMMMSFTGIAALMLLYTTTPPRTPEDL